jgi:hypothetical protein
VFARRFVGQIVACSVLALSFAHRASAQDDPFDVPAPAVVTPRANAELATVRVLAFAPVTHDADASPGRRASVVVRRGQGALVDRGFVVTSASVVGLSTFVLVSFPGESTPRVAYVVRTDDTRGLSILAIPSIRSLSLPTLERRLPSQAAVALTAFAYPTDDALVPTGRVVTLGTAHTSGRRRVANLGGSSGGAPIVGADDTARGLVHVESDGERTLVPIVQVHLFLDEMRASGEAIRGAMPEAEALARDAALTLLRAQATADDAALVRELAPMATPEHAERADLPTEAVLVIAAAHYDLAESAAITGGVGEARGRTLARLARIRVRHATARDQGLVGRSVFARTVSAEPTPDAEPAQVVETAAIETAAIETPAAQEAPAPIADGETRLRSPEAGRLDTPPSLPRTYVHTPRFFVLSLGMPFAPDADVHIGGVALEATALWLVPRGVATSTHRLGFAVGPSFSAGANGGSGTGRMGVELGFLGRIARKPGLFFSTSWVPGVYFGEGTKALTATAFRARVGVSIERITIALGYDLASPNGLYAYHAFHVAFVRER